MTAKCCHVLQSSTKRSPYCSTCVLKKAEAEFDAAQKDIVQQGGLNPPAELRDEIWRKARLTYKIALRNKERSKRQIKSQRDSEKFHELMTFAFHSPTGVVEEDYFWVIHRNKAWWEISGKLAPEPDLGHESGPAALSPPPKRRPDKALVEKKAPKASQAIRDLVKTSRASFALQKEWEAEDIKWGLLWKLESVVRAKLNIHPNFMLPKEFLEMPYPLSRICRCLLKHPKARRNTDQHKKWQKPGPSRLRSVVSVDDFEVSEETLKEEEAKTLAILRRQAIDSWDVVNMYFVGGRVVPSLPPPLPDVVMEESSVVFSVEPAQPSGTSQTGESGGGSSLFEDALFEQFIDTSMLQDGGPEMEADLNDVEMSDVADT